MRPRSSRQCREGSRAVEVFFRRRIVPTSAVAIAHAEQQPEPVTVDKSGLLECSAEVFEGRGKVLRREVHLADFFTRRDDGAPRWFAAILFQPLSLVPCVGHRFLELSGLNQNELASPLRDAVRYLAHRIMNFHHNSQNTVIVPVSRLELDVSPTGGRFFIPDKPSASP